jgi:hypothetical protein
MVKISALVLTLLAAIPFELFNPLNKVDAFTLYRDIAITRQRDESFDALNIRGQAISRAYVQQSFDQDILVSEVVLTVIAQNQGLIAPIFKVTVTRDEWRNNPNPEFWLSAYSTSSSLLNMGEIIITAGQ